MAQVSSCRGSVLYLTVAMTGLMVAALLLAFGIYFLFFSQKRLEDKSESTALQAAQYINERDYSGKLNNLQRASRELVFSARSMLDQTGDEDFAEFNGLAAQIMAESRQGSVLLDAERNKYNALTLTRLKSLVDQNTQIQSIELGSFSRENRAEDSNVQLNTGEAQLADYDQARGYLNKGKLLTLYRAGVDLRLPEPDSDLRFVLAALQAPIKNTVAPLRLVDGAQKFSKQIAIVPNMAKLPPGYTGVEAVRLTMKSTVKQKALEGLGQGQATISSTSAARAAGALPEFK
jgi:hypothetical protein